MGKIIFENILFDLDGTLTDPYIGITNSILYSLKYYPEITVPEREYLKPFIGPPLTDSYMRYFGFSEAKAKEAVEHYREYYSEKGILEDKLYDGIGSLLRELNDKGKKVIMATSKPEVFAKRIAENFGLCGCFDYICGSTLDGIFVKKEDIIAKIIKVLSLDREKTVMVGDTLFDIEGAKANSIKAVAVLYGYGERGALISSGADGICENVNQLRKYLLQK